MGLFLKKKINPHETILKAVAIEFFTLENYAPSAYIFSMAKWLKVNILQRSVFNYAISLHSDNNYHMTCTNLIHVSDPLAVSSSFYPYVWELAWLSYLLIN